MNFLELVQTAYGLSRVGQGDVGEEPASVTGQSGKLGEFVRFVRFAWNDIQNSQPGWRFMRRESALTLPQGQSVVSPLAIENFDSIVLADSDGRGRAITIFRDDISSEQIIRFVPWGDWQQSYLQRGPKGVGQPATFTIAPSGDLEFDLEADAPYTLRLFHKRTPQSLQQDGDIPIMPAKYHMAIVWWAIVNYYCTTRANNDPFRTNSMANLKREMRILHHEQLDEHLGIEVVQ